MPRRVGDPAGIVAAADEARTVLGWQPQFDDLATIIANALAWERELATRRGVRLEQAVRLDRAVRLAAEHSHPINVGEMS